MKSRYILKRISTYLADYVIVSLIVQGVTSVLIRRSSFSESYTYAELSKFSEADLLAFVYQYLESLINQYVIICAVFLIYYVVMTKYFNGRTLGCFITGMIIIGKGKISASSLTMRALFNEGLIIYMLVPMYVIAFKETVTLPIVYAFTSIFYGIFLIINFVFLLNNGVSLVDRMSNSRPIMIVKSNE